MINKSPHLPAKQPHTLVYVHSGVYPSDSPSITFVTYNAIGLAAVFEQVILFVKKGKSASLEQILLQRFNLNCPDNLQIIRLPGIIAKTNTIFFIFTMFRLIAIRKSLLGVITRNLTFLPYLKQFADFTHLPVFFESHDFFTDLSLRDDRITTIKQRNNRLEKKYLSRLTGLICLQNAQKNLYQKYYPDLPIHVLRTGLPEIHQTPITPRRYLAYIGSFDKHKGLETIIKAASLSETHPQILFIGAKNNADVNSVQAMAAQYHYSDKVHIHHWIAKSELHLLLKDIKLGIVPITDSFFNRFITSPLKIFDYYAFGIPVLATDLPTTRELIDNGKTGFLFQVDDVKAFAADIDLLYGDDGLYASMVQNVYAKAATLLWSQRAKQLHDIIISL